MADDKDQDKDTEEDGAGQEDTLDDQTDSDDQDSDDDDPEAKAQADLDDLLKRQAEVRKAINDAKSSEGRAKSEVETENKGLRGDIDQLKTAIIALQSRGDDVDEDSDKKTGRKVSGYSQEDLDNMDEGTFRVVTAIADQVGSQQAGTNKAVKQILAKLEDNDAQSKAERANDNLYQSYQKEYGIERAHFDQVMELRSEGNHLDADKILETVKKVSEARTNKAREREEQRGQIVPSGRLVTGSQSSEDSDEDEADKIITAEVDKIKKLTGEKRKDSIVALYTDNRFSPQARELIAKRTLGATAF